MEWVQSVPKNVEHMALIRELASDLDISLTVHAPYFINLNSKEKDKLAASKFRILSALRMAQLAGAWSVCVHAAFYQGSSSEETLKRVMDATHDILKHRSKDFPDVNLAYETMGKPTQFGTYDELFAIAEEFDIFPCVDFAHIHARCNGGENSTAEWQAQLDRYAKALGKKSLKKMHMHYSGINYTEKGERNHLPFPESDAKWKDLLKVLKEYGIGGTLVVESPLLEEETSLLAAAFARLH
jgi:deoxyribonuclease-4